MYLHAYSTVPLCLDISLWKKTKGVSWSLKTSCPVCIFANASWYNAFSVF